MKKPVRLALGGGMLVALLGLVGCGGADEGMEAGADADRAKSVADQMKSMGTMTAPKKAPPTVGKDTTSGGAEAK